MPMFDMRTQAGDIIPINRCNARAFCYATPKSDIELPRIVLMSVAAPNLEWVCLGAVACGARALFANHVICSVVSGHSVLGATG